MNTNPPQTRTYYNSDIPSVLSFLLSRQTHFEITIFGTRNDKYEGVSLWPQNVDITSDGVHGIVLIQARASNYGHENFVWKKGSHASHGIHGVDIQAIRVSDKELNHAYESFFRICKAKVSLEIRANRVGPKCLPCLRFILGLIPSISPAPS